MEEDVPEKDTCPDELNQLQSILLHLHLSAGAAGFRRQVFGLERQSRDPSDGRGGAQLHGQGGRFWTGQVTHLTHACRRVVQIGAELADPLRMRR